ncbi:MAG: DUF3726 domain-containing protein [Candidatus Competibacteraceae bacterium]|nr:DUF3726 domain-containing protein [Candidatus Competibacteraceae bacterium]
MRVAHNEFLNLCRKVFEGQGLSLGDYEDCAEAIVWLEMHGLDGVAELQVLLDHPPLGEVAPPRFEGETLAVLEGTDWSRVCGALAVDLAYTKALHRGMAVVELVGSPAPKLVIRSLLDCARRGVNVLARWRDAAAREHLATVEAGESYPAYRLLEAGKSGFGAVGASPITIVCSQRFSLKADDTGPGLIRLTPHDFAGRYRRALAEGIEVEEALWQRLVNLSRNVLVESTEQSRRRGAGYGGF